MTLSSELELDADGLAHVPTCAELGRVGLAREIPGTKGSIARWEISAAGYERMRLAMKHNAETLIANPTLRRRLEAEAFRA